MKEISLTQTQLEDAMGTLETAVDGQFDNLDRANGYYEPEAIEVPRPDFNTFKTQVEALERPGLELQRGRFTVQPKDVQIFRAFAGLRGIAATTVATGSGTATITGPAIVLAGGRDVALLTAEQAGPAITPMQHSFLEAEYSKHLAAVLPSHSPQDVINAGDIGPALVVVSSIRPEAAHQDMHNLAKGTDLDRSLRTFGVNFSASGRQDITIGNKTRRPRSHILPLHRVLMSVAEHDQLAPEVDLLGIKLTAGEMAVGMTLAATTSRKGGSPDLGANLSNMVHA